MEFRNLQDLMIKFSDERVCIEYLKEKRWSNGVVCPYCSYNKKIYSIENGKRFKCSNPECYKKFSVTVGTIFENTKIKLNVWFGAIYLCTAHKKGISSLQLHRDLGVTQKTAWFMLQRIREMLKRDAPDMMKTTVEIDETYVGGKETNKHGHKKRKGKEVKSYYGRNRDIKTPVLGILERDGDVYAQKVVSAHIKTLLPIIEKHVQKGATVMTDSWPAYLRLGINYDHYTIDHSKGYYGRGEIHTNTIEGFWSLFKRGIIGIYHSVSYKHLNHYCTEFAFRYNTRKVTDPQRFHIAMGQIEGKRMLFRVITAKYYGLA